ncbi:DUF3857 domain-containing protein [Candidatus Odyssella acanthamoebae]|uniref:DUF3857 domain-containing protein n=1 Tax=Candidatus Odyssella acanthamoebae TaxID=91604 RepID=A0A077AT95_9PROT|nr:DUF3857 domain-containing protein [Candidatus Paracaedibacter acanthamoebae]AIK95606.1 hypothetical protein ID47_00785 [Candidatus Paracaedibacter acanthamoebae]
MRWPKFLFIIGWALVLEASATPEYAIGEPAAWIQPGKTSKEPKDISKYSPYGAYYYLVNRQIKKEADAVYSYIQVIKKVTNQKGVTQQASVEISFDPLSESITLHTIKVIRGKQVINQLSSDKIKVLQREQELESNIYNGYKSGLLHLKRV